MNTNTYKDDTKLRIISKKNHLFFSFSMLDSWKVKKKK